MVKFVHVITCLVLSFCACAQQVEAKADMQVLIRDFFQISNLATQGQIVTLELNNEDDLEKGLNKEIKSNLMVTSTVDYNLFARAAFPVFYNQQSRRSFPSSVLQVEIINTDLSLNGTTLEKVLQLTTLNQPLISEGKPLFKSAIDIRYSIPAEQTREYLLKAGSGVYSNTVIYTISPQ